MSNKDFDKYSYFVSKSRNFAIVIKPTRKKTVDGEVLFEEGLRVEFNNHFLRVENTPSNQFILEALRKRLEDEKYLEQKSKSFYEETRPKVMIAEEELEGVITKAIDKKNIELEKKDAEIAELRKKLNERGSENRSTGVQVGSNKNK